MFINFSHLFNVHLLFNVIDVNIRSMHYFNGLFFFNLWKVSYSPFPQVSQTSSYVSLLS